jgi:general nucleoside transport system permease protein
MSINLLALLTATLVIATPLVWAGIGELVIEKTGILDLGIEGTMVAGAFGGFVVADLTGSVWVGLVAAVLAGAVAGLLMGLFTVSLGLNQHVSGLGLTLLLIALCEFGSRVRYGGERPRLEDKFDRLLDGVPVLEQHWLTYVGFLVLAPLVWWLLAATGFGYRLRAVGESFEAADVAGFSVNGTRFLALVIGSVLMAVGGSFLTLFVLGTYTLDIINGRGWVCIALVIFATWRVWRVVAGALLFAATDALQLQLAITDAFADVPRELMLALPYLAVIAALAVWGRSVQYPATYLQAHRRA